MTEENTQQNQEEKKEVEIPEKFASIVSAIDALTVIELNELVKVFEEKYGVSASAMMAAAPAQGDGSDASGESSTVSVELTSAGDQKIQVIKAVKDIMALGLKEAKDLVDGAPEMLKEGVKKEEAEEIKKKIEEAGGSVTFK